MAGRSTPADRMKLYRRKAMHLVPAVGRRLVWKA